MEQGRREARAAVRPGWRRHAAIVTALWVAALGAYGNSFHAGFDSGSAALLSGHGDGHYRPLSAASYRLDRSIGGSGERATGHHGVNFLLHAANIALVYGLGLLVLGETVPAAALAALWAVHPVLTASVTDVAGRADLLAGLGVLGGLLCYVKSGRGQGCRRAAWLTGAAGAAAVAIFSQESGVALVGAVAVWDVCFSRGPWRSRLGGWGAILAPPAAWWWMRGQVLSRLPAAVPGFLENPLRGADFPAAQLTAVKVIGKYLWLLVWPAHLSADYSYNQVPVAGFGGWGALLALAVCAGAAVLAVRSVHRNPPLAFFAGFFFAALAPVANLATETDAIMAERYLYLPAIGFAGCAVLAWQVFARRRARAAWAASGLVCVLLAGRTFARNFDFRDDFSLWTATAASSPDSARAHTLLAEQWLAREGGIDRAVEEAARAVAIVNGLPDERNSARVFATAGMCYRRKGESVAYGRPWYEKAAAVLERGRRIDQRAFQAMLRANEDRRQRLAPAGWAPLYLDLGRTYQRLSRPGDAIDALDYGVALEPLPQFFEEMSNAYRSAGVTDKAAEALIEGIAIGPDYAPLRQRLVEFYRETAPGGCALRPAGGGEEPNPGCPAVHDHMCSAAVRTMALQQRMGRFAAAAATQARMLRDLGCQLSMRR